jgi:hypothetical protein
MSGFSPHEETCQGFLVRSNPMVDNIHYSSHALHVTQLRARLEQIERNPIDDAQSYLTKLRVQNAPTDAHTHLDANCCFRGQYSGWTE